MSTLPQDKADMTQFLQAEGMEECDSWTEGQQQSPAGGHCLGWRRRTSALGSLSDFLQGIVGGTHSSE